MKETELKPCPLCGESVEIKDYTDNLYGFCDYMIKCKKHPKQKREPMTE